MPLTMRRAILGLCVTAVIVACGSTSWADDPGPDAQDQVVIKDRQSDSPLVLDQPTDYVIQRVNLSGMHDAAALTLTGQINSVTLQNCRFGDVVAGPHGKAVALEAVGAVVGSLIATDTQFYDAENQLVSLRDGSFGTVTFLHCSFKTSDSFLKRIYEQTPWRTEPPVTEFYNIDRLELLDNEYGNTMIVIHPSVKTVVFRGDISRVQIESSETQVIRLSPQQEPDGSISPAALAEDANANDPARPADRPTLAVAADDSAPTWRR